MKIFVILVFVLMFNTSTFADDEVKVPELQYSEPVEDETPGSTFGGIFDISDEPKSVPDIKEDNAISEYEVEKNLTSEDEDNVTSGDEVENKPTSNVGSVFGNIFEVEVKGNQSDTLSSTDTSIIRGDRSSNNYYAAENNSYNLTKVSMLIDSEYIYINGKSVDTGISTIIYNNRMYIPLNYLTYIKNVKVSWNSNNRTASVIYKNTKLSFAANSSAYTVNGNSYSFDGKVLAMNNRFYVPVRVIGSALDFGVEWDSRTNTATYWVYK